MLNDAHLKVLETNYIRDAKQKSFFQMSEIFLFDKLTITQVTLDQFLFLFFQFTMGSS